MYDNMATPKMTIEEFGKRVREKYPQYNDLSDFDIGQRVLNKYPQYQDLVATSSAEISTPKKATFLSNRPTLKGIGDFLGLTGLAKGAAQVLYFKTKEGRELLERAQRGEITPEELEYTSGGLATPGEVIGSGIQTIGTIGLAGAGRAVGQTALKRIFKSGVQTGIASGIISGGKAIEEGRSAAEVAGRAGMGAVAGGVIGGGFSALSELATYASKAIGPRLVERTLGIPSKVIERGRSPAQRFLQEGKGFTQSGVLSNARKAANVAEQEIQKVLTTGAKKGGAVETNVIIQKIRDNLKRTYGDALGPEEIDAIINKLPIAALRSNATVSISRLNQLRSTIDNRFLGDSKWLRINDPVNISAMKTAANIMRAIVQGTDSRLPPLFARLADNIVLGRSLQKEIARRHAMTLTLEIIGSALYGGITGGGINKEAFGNAAKALALLRVFTSTPATLTAAKGIYKVGGAVGSDIAQRIFKTAAANIPKQFRFFYSTVGEKESNESTR